MGNCRECKHWTPPEPSTKAFNPEGFGLCGLGHGLSWPYGPVSHGQTLAFASDEDAGNEYQSRPAELRTMPEFGCVQWSKKDD